MSITYLKDDATCPQAKGNRVICHICNDIGGWGKGFVLVLSRRWPEPEAGYRSWHTSGKAGGFMLGAEWSRVEPLIQEHLCSWDVPVTVYDFD